MRIRVPGLHNVYNSLAAVAVGLDLNLDFEQIAAAMMEFRGAERRFQIKGEVNGVMVVDDYGHHPTEIKATLEAARTSGRRVVTLFQPHRYTRTRDLMDEFARSFYEADVLLVCDIYAASEDPIEGITSRALVDMIERHGHRHVEYIGAVTNGAARIKEIAQPGDLVLTLGAGNVNQAGDELLNLLNG
jgi:UDP-N-acetylmuramate--alanine ligase